MLRLRMYGLLAAMLLPPVGGIRGANLQPAAASDQYSSRIQPGTCCFSV
jgi:hypothetical protein